MTFAADRRPAVTSDAESLVTVWRRAVEATHHFLTSADIDGIEQDVRMYLPQMNDLRVAVHDDVPVGFIAQDDGEIHMLFVDPAVHGRGIGSALLADVARDHAVLHVDVNEDNASGRAFYAARGFTTRGRSELDGEGRAFPLLHLRREAD